MRKLLLASVLAPVALLVFSSPALAANGSASVGSCSASTEWYFPAPSPYLPGATGSATYSGVTCTSAQAYALLDQLPPSAGASEGTSPQGGYTTGLWWTPAGYSDDNCATGTLHGPNGGYGTLTVGSPVTLADIQYQVVSTGQVWEATEHDTIPTAYPLTTSPGYASCGGLFGFGTASWTFSAVNA